MNSPTVLDWLVVLGIVGIPLGGVWLYVEIRILLDERRDRRERDRRPGFVNLQPPRTENTGKRSL